MTVKTYVARYRLPDGRQVSVQISDTRLEDAASRARWRAMAVALEHGVPWPSVELVGIEEVQPGEAPTAAARAAALATRLAESRAEAHRLVDAAHDIVSQRRGLSFGLN